MRAKGTALAATVRKSETCVASIPMKRQYTRNMEIKQNNFFLLTTGSMKITIILIDAPWSECM